MTRAFILSVTMAIVIGLSNVCYATNNRIVNYNGNQKIQQLLIKQKIVDLQQPYGLGVIGVPVTGLGLGYYYSVTGDQSNDALADKIVDKVIRKLNANQPVTNQPNKPQNNVTNNPLPANTTVDGSDLKEQVENLFIQKCAKCHTGDGAAGGVKIIENGRLADSFTEKTYEGLKDRALAWDRIDGNNLDRGLVMPKNGTPLDQASVNIVREWLREELNEVN